jgi:hypothetical protein
VDSEMSGAQSGVIERKGPPKGYQFSLTNGTNKTIVFVLTRFDRHYSKELKPNQTFAPRNLLLAEGDRVVSVFNTNGSVLETTKIEIDNHIWLTFKNIEGGEKTLRENYVPKSKTTSSPTEIK